MHERSRAKSAGWLGPLTRWAGVALAFEAATGLLVTLAPFHHQVEWMLLAHTVAGLVLILPLTLYLAVHWRDYRRFALSDGVVLGYLAGLALVVCAVSGLVVTWQALFTLRMSAGWRNVHLVSAVAVLAATAAHLWSAWARARSKQLVAPVGALLARSTLPAAAAMLAVAVVGWRYPGPRYENAFPADYSFLYGADRPFAPSLARTETGGAFDPDSLAHSESCGTAGCHVQIVEEWRPSAHRYAAMDPLFQGIQRVMAEQNGPESTRYCGGCHDPISLFSGSKTLHSDELSGSLGHDEGVSCLGCHGIRETDVQGNANFVMSQPAAYLWQWDTDGWRRVARDFLVRSYPDEHRKLSKRAFKAPEYCAACHKQFIDQEVNRVGWVQLQNQYDNWKASHWSVPGQPERTVECRECHMPLVDSDDPAAGDDADYNRSAGDRKHRSHRFIAANAMVPTLLQLPGWEMQVELTERWLRGELEIPEIAEKWAAGPVVHLALEVPPVVPAGEKVPIRVVLTSNKVGHDFPTGPLDIIQSWVELAVDDPSGNRVYTSGARDERHFLEPGTFLFKAEPVDQYGNLIDRHNLWEMVGVRFRRALFPGYSDAVEYLVDCPSSLVPAAAAPSEAGPSAQTREIELATGAAAGRYRVVATLYYRKVDQFLVNYLLGEKAGQTAPVVAMTRREASFELAAPAGPRLVAPRTGVTGRRDDALAGAGAGAGR